MRDPIILGPCEVPRFSETRKEASGTKPEALLGLGCPQTCAPAGPVDSNLHKL